MRVDHWVFEQLEKLGEFPVTRTLIRKWILDGKLKLVHSAVRLPTRFARPGEKFVLELDDRDIPAPLAVAQDIDVPLIFRDEYIIAVSKPPGLPSQPTLDPRRLNLFDWLKTTHQLTYLGQHHRLDRDTSGVIVFTVSEKANKGLADAFKEREAQKTYLAVVEKQSKPFPAVGESFRVKNFLKRGEGKAARMRSVRSGGDVAETEFLVLGVAQDRALIQAMPKTGRMHQIRVHLSELGFPIVGDRDYGARSSGRTLLHAAELVLNHPVHQTALVLKAPLPHDFIECLTAYRLPIPPIPRTR